MISVIICSRSQDLLEKLKLNIKKTIGVEYEIIAYDNSEASDGICKVYNLCSKKAKFEYLCYIHEDVHFITTDWGKELVSNYTPDTGVIGLAGGMFKSSFPSSWGYPGMEYCRVNIFHISNECHLSQNPSNENYTLVDVLDGVFLFTSKLVWEEYPFDEITFDRFHLYDQDFTFNVAHKYNNYVCHTIELIHYSWGSFNLEWANYAEKFCEKWKHELPYTKLNLSLAETRKAEQIALYWFIKDVLIKGKLPLARVSHWFFLFIKKYPFTNRSVTLTIKYITLLAKNVKKTINNYTNPMVKKTYKKV
jgi:hypothetical protein